MTQKTGPANRARGRRPLPTSHWDWRTFLYIAIGIALCSWGPVEMTFRKEILPIFIVVFVTGLAFFAAAYRAARLNRKVQP